MMFLFLIPFVSSIDFYADLNMKSKNIYNATNISATRFLGDGSLLTGVTGGGGITNISSNLDMNGYNILNATNVSINSTLNVGSGATVASIQTSGNNLNISSIGTINLNGTSVNIGALKDNRSHISIGMDIVNSTFSVNISNASNDAVYLTRYYSGTLGPHIEFRKYGNTTDINGRVASSSELGVIDFKGYDGTLVQRSAYFYVISTQAWNTTARGTKIQILNTANDAITAAVALTIHHNGNVGIGASQTSPAYKLAVDGTSWLNGTIKTHLPNVSAEQKSIACINAAGEIYRGNATGCP